MSTYSTLFIFSILFATAACFTVRIIEDPLNETSPLYGKPFQKIGDHYYILNDKLKLDWIAAEYYCRKHDAHLTSFETTDEMNAVFAYLISKDIGDYDLYWIGSNDLNLDKKFYWINSGKEALITKWGNGEPNILWGTEKCVHLFRRYNEIWMNDRNCGVKGHFICKAYPQKIVLSVLS